MSQEQKKRSEEDAGSGLDFQLPDTKGILGKLETAQKSELRREHTELMDEEDKEDKKSGRAPKKRQKRTSAICFCGDPSCRIGPFTETQGKSEDA